MDRTCWRLYIEPDDYPEDVSWQLRSASDDSLLREGDVHGEICDRELPTDGCYIFYIRDAVGDGLTKPDGTWTMYWNNRTWNSPGNGVYQGGETLNFCGEGNILF